MTHLTKNHLLVHKLSCTLEITLEILKEISYITNHNAGLSKVASCRQKLPPAW